MVYDPAQGREMLGQIDLFIYQKDRCGEIVAYKEEGTKQVHIGFAIMHAEDRKRGYDKAGTREKALLVADKSYEENIYVNKLGKVGVPHLIRYNIAHFVNRIFKYYGEDVEIPNWAAEVYEKVAVDSMK
jgi:hypothetical protein